jgi:competence protein ComEC
MSPSKIFLYFCLSFIGGIFLNSVIQIPQILMLGFLILGILLISVLWTYKKLAIFGFCVLFLVLGIWRHQNVQSASWGTKLQILNNTEETITLIGIVAEEPTFGKNSTKLKIKTNAGSFLVTTGRYPDYKYGDVLEITGKLKTPSEDINGFNYKEYLSKDGIYSEMSFPEIVATGENKGSIVYKYLFSFKNKLEESVNSVMSPPQSALLNALFFGDTSGFSQEWTDKFNLTGTRHIVAVSGMNITIISALIISFLLSLGFWRQQAFWVSVIFIIFYVLMIGAPASAVRAGIMGLIFLCAQRFGRASSASLAVVFASTFMLAQNPLLLRLDVGFQLSFLAVMGLIYLQPILSEAFKNVPDFFQIRYALAATISAQIFTLPILIFNFSRISLISSLANILIVPTLSFITILGFIFSLAGLIFYPLGLLLSWPAWFLISYVLAVINFFAKIPFATIQIQKVSWAFFILFYVVIFFSVWWLRKRFSAQKF